MWAHDTWFLFERHGASRSLNDLQVAVCSISPDNPRTMSIPKRPWQVGDMGLFFLGAVATLYYAIENVP